MIYLMALNYIVWTLIATVILLMLWHVYQQLKADRLH